MAGGQFVEPIADHEAYEQAKGFVSGTTEYIYRVGVLFLCGENHFEEEEVAAARKDGACCVCRKECGYIPFNPLNREIEKYLAKYPARKELQYKTHAERKAREAELNKESDAAVQADEKKDEVKAAGDPPQVAVDVNPPPVALPAVEVAPAADAPPSFALVAKLGSPVPPPRGKQAPAMPVPAKLPEQKRGPQPKPPAKQPEKKREPQPKQPAPRDAFAAVAEREKEKEKEKDINPFSLLPEADDARGDHDGQPARIEDKAPPPRVAPAAAEQKSEELVEVERFLQKFGSKFPLFKNEIVAGGAPGTMTVRHNPKGMFDKLHAERIIEKKSIAEKLKNELTKKAKNEFVISKKNVVLLAQAIRAHEAKQEPAAAAPQSHPQSASAADKKMLGEASQAIAALESLGIQLSNPLVRRLRPSDAASVAPQSHPQPASAAGEEKKANKKKKKNKKKPEEKKAPAKSAASAAPVAEGSADHFFFMSNAMSLRSVTLAGGDEAVHFINEFNRKNSLRCICQLGSNGNIKLVGHSVEPSDVFVKMYEARVMLSADLPFRIAEKFLKTQDGYEMAAAADLDLLKEFVSAMRKYQNDAGKESKEAAASPSASGEHKAVGSPAAAPSKQERVSVDDVARAVNIFKNYINANKEFFTTGSCRFVSGVWFDQLEPKKLFLHMASEDIISKYFAMEMASAFRVYEPGCYTMATFECIPQFLKATVPSEGDLMAAAEFINEYEMSVVSRGTRWGFSFEQNKIVLLWGSPQEVFSRMATEGILTDKFSKKMIAACESDKHARSIAENNFFLIPKFLEAARAYQKRENEKRIADEVMKRRIEHAAEVVLGRSAQQAATQDMQASVIPFTTSAVSDLLAASAASPVPPEKKSAAGLAFASPAPASAAGLHGRRGSGAGAGVSPVERKAAHSMETVEKQIMSEVLAAGVEEAIGFINDFAKRKFLDCSCKFTSYGTIPCFGRVSIKKVFFEMEKEGILENDLCHRISEEFRSDLDGGIGKSEMVTEFNIDLIKEFVAAIRPHKASQQSAVSAAMEDTAAAIGLSGRMGRAGR